MLKPIARFILALGVMFLCGSSTAIAAEADAPSLSPLATVDLTASLAQPVFTSPSVKAPAVGAKMLRFGMYASFATLQALDAHSTLRAVRAGGHEANPLMTGVASKPASLIALKAGTAAATVFLIEKLSKRNQVASVIVMAALNSVYATVVAHNYGVARR